MNITHVLGWPQLQPYQAQSHPDSHLCHVACGIIDESGEGNILCHTKLPKSFLIGCCMMLHLPHHVHKVSLNFVCVLINLISECNVHLQI